MSQDVGNPMADHLLARMIFNITRHMSTGSLVIFVLPDVSDVDFCAEQLLAIEKSECLVPKVRRIFPAGAGPQQQAKMRAFRLSSIEQDFLDVMLVDKPPGLGNEYHADYNITLNIEGEMKVDKARSGVTTDSFFPYEMFKETLTHA